eukprot:CAMPEP_0206408070 /NCGR_PEP_ID=MMETSP0294-20121207/30903_1 /ASSEMBLY_ACC=CAM_ASM_000327 /TAXON_ID=39354 /ORGANISM="Heterosigma akashiwo, Strain CCMP2393" /LENGTH=191 /DNA_ID=CAMNT_0053867405 /DNA_START=125 /DNA_END=700 /DNA_ORIENTATION=+
MSMSFKPLPEGELRAALVELESKIQARFQKAAVGEGTGDKFEPLSDKQVWGFTPEQKCRFMFGEGTGDKFEPLSDKQVWGFTPEQKCRFMFGEGTGDKFEPLSDKQVWGFTPEQKCRFMFGSTGNAESKKEFLYNNQDDSAKVAMSRELLDATGAVFKNAGNGDCFFMALSQHLVLEEKWHPPRSQFFFTV